ncbi:hypothetical protein FA15DRAFT_391224 [Coprinopsis marcescibilis]|uniref:Uncharacterized protein n=1 Tax=Coprinopsis marcescibilis TaxID=230819 RepID=A0A5C3KWX8_COPMA|nr:hypothetical protein FA15DRAFT_391224 [Coprinopsis marcescibilis]
MSAPAEDSHRKVEEKGTRNSIKLKASKGLDTRQRQPNGFGAVSNAVATAQASVPVDLPYTSAEPGLPAVAVDRNGLQRTDMISDILGVERVFKNY